MYFNKTENSVIFLFFTSMKSATCPRKILFLQLERKVETVSPLQDPICESASSDIFQDISISHEVPDTEPDSDYHQDSPPGSPELTKPCSDQPCHQNIEYRLVLIVRVYTILFRF